MLHHLRIFSIPTPCSLYIYIYIYVYVYTHTHIYMVCVCIKLINNDEMNCGCLPDIGH